MEVASERVREELGGGDIGVRNLRGRKEISGILGTMREAREE